MERKLLCSVCIPTPLSSFPPSNDILDVQLLNADCFYQVTGTLAPPSPVTAESYAAAGLPFYSLPNEQSSGIKSVFSDVKSVAQFEKEKKGTKTLDRNLKFPTVELDQTGHVSFRPVADLDAQVKALGILSQLG